jgi:hypothetical protein
VRTTSGILYRLVGKPSCDRLVRARLSLELCEALHDGLPENWRQLLDDEWHRLFDLDKVCARA